MRTVYCSAQIDLRLLSLAGLVFLGASTGAIIFCWFLRMLVTL